MLAAETIRSLVNRRLDPAEYPLNTEIVVNGLIELQKNPVLTSFCMDSLSKGFMLGYRLTDHSVRVTDFADFVDKFAELWLWDGHSLPLNPMYEKGIWKSFQERFPDFVPILRGMEEWQKYYAPVFDSPTEYPEWDRKVSLEELTRELRYGVAQKSPLWLILRRFFIGATNLKNIDGLAYWDEVNDPDIAEKDRKYEDVHPITYALGILGIKAGKEFDPWKYHTMEHGSVFEDLFRQVFDQIIELYYCGHSIPARGTGLDQISPILQNRDQIEQQDESVNRDYTVVTEELGMSPAPYLWYYYAQSPDGAVFFIENGVKRDQPDRIIEIKSHYERLNPYSTLGGLYTGQVFQGCTAHDVPICYFISGVYMPKIYRADKTRRPEEPNEILVTIEAVQVSPAMKRIYSDLCIAYAFMVQLMAYKIHFIRDVDDTAVTPVLEENRKHRQFTPEMFGEFGSVIQKMSQFCLSRKQAVRDNYKQAEMVTRTPFQISVPDEETGKMRTEYLQRKKLLLDTDIFAPEDPRLEKWRTTTVQEAAVHKYRDTERELSMWREQHYEGSRNWKQKLAEYFAKKEAREAAEIVKKEAREAAKIAKEEEKLRKQNERVAKALDRELAKAAKKTKAVAGAKKQKTLSFLPNGLPDIGRPPKRFGFL